MKRITTLLLITLLLTACASAETFETLSAAQLLEIGEGHLLEGDYERASLYFTRLIEVEPMNSQGYTGLARAYVGLENLSKAREVLGQGREYVPEDPVIGDLLEELRCEGEREQLEVKAMELLEGLAALEEEALLAELSMGGLTHIVAEFYQALDFPLIFDEIGIYQTSAGFMLYQGDFVDGQREGFGRWLTLDGWYFSEGQWSGDMPNGLFRVQWGGRMDVGEVVNGLWHGALMRTVFISGHVFVPAYDMGRVVVIERLSETPVGHPDSVYVVYRDSNGDPFLMTETYVNSLQGIRGFAD